MRFSTPFGEPKVFCGHRIPLACAVGRAAAFAVNAALGASQWQHRVRTVFLHPPINTYQDAGQAANSVFQVYGVTQPGTEPSVPDLVAFALLRICKYVCLCL